MLSLLEKKELYGYALISSLSEKLSADMAEGTVYPLLNRMVRDELLSFDWRIMETGPARKYYKISKRGRQMLKRMHRHWSSVNKTLQGVWGAAKYYGVAVGYPIVVLGAIAALAYVFGAVDTSDANWKIALVNIALGSSIGVIMVVITEEGFFRGWLWASLRRLELTDVQVLIATSVVFTLWHVSVISFDTGFNIPAKEIPIYLTNATLLGVIFGLLRFASGSIVVASVCHAVWNAFAYTLFGFGENVGELGIKATHVFGPEVGLVGIVFNLAVAVGLWVWIRPAASGA